MTVRLPRFYGLPAARTATSLHAGLSIIGALSSSFGLESRRGSGTEIEARLPLIADPQTA